MTEGPRSRPAGRRAAGMAALLFLACLAGAVAALPGAGAAPLDVPAPPLDVPAAESTPGLRLLESNEGQVVLELRTLALEVTAGTDAAGPCDRLTAPGYAAWDRPGYPSLPVHGALLGIPPGADVTLVLLEADVVDLPGAFDLCPVARPLVSVDAAGPARSAGYEVTRDPQAYAVDAFSPSSPAELLSVGWVRDQRVAQVRFHPFQYNAATGRLRQVRSLRVALRFSGGRAPDADAPVETTDPFDEVLSGVLLNYETAHSWRQVFQPVAALSDRPLTPSPAYKVHVESDGLYQITPAELQAAGVDPTAIDPRTLRLHDQGQEVALYGVGEGDGRLDPADVLLFYGQAPNSRYARTRVYWLTWGGDAGRRMGALSGTPGGTAPTPSYFRTQQRVEEDLNYQAGWPSGPERDHWYWGWVWASAPASGSYEGALQGLATEPLSATVSGLLRGYDATPQHHTLVRLNGHLIDDAAWEPTAEYSFTVDVPQSYLVEGTNTFVVECPLDGGVSEDYVIVNRFDVDYHRLYQAQSDLLFFEGDEAGAWEYRVGGFTTAEPELYDITDPLAPSRILGAVVTSEGGAYTVAFEQTLASEHRFLALSPARRLSPVLIESDTPSDLQAPTRGADYVILTHRDFYTAVQPLADYRAAQGLRADVIDVQDVYDEFAYGAPEPEAIRDFLAYAYAHWAPPAPTYVLLVGDGNYDLKDNLGRGEPNYIPPYLADADPWFGETAADNRYVCVSGDDILPDMHLGRLPVKSVAEAVAVVAKILAYEAIPPTVDWNDQVLLVADNADSGGEFDDHADRLADSYLPAPYAADKVYLGITHSTASEGKAAILAAINQGRLLVGYHGHSSIQFWAFEHMLDLANVRTLANFDRLPFAMPMTCLEGYYIHPSLSTTDLSALAEGFVRNPGGGAIASWSPTGMGLAEGHTYLGEGLFRALFYEGVYRLGPATTQAKLHLYASTAGYRDQIDTYVLLGDPALALNVLPVDLSLQKRASLPATAFPGDRITYTLTFSNAGPATAHGLVLSDALPAALLNPVVSWAGASLTPVADSRLAWQVADLAAGEGGVVTLTATLDPQFSGLLVNTAQITGAAREVDLVDNRASHAVTVSQVWHSIYLPVVLRSTAPAQLGVSPSD